MLPPNAVTSPETCPRTRMLQPKQVASPTSSSGPMLMLLPTWVRSRSRSAKAALSEAERPAGCLADFFIGADADVASGLGPVAITIGKGSARQDGDEDQDGVYHSEVAKIAGHGVSPGS